MIIFWWLQHGGWDLVATKFSNIAWYNFGNWLFHFLQSKLDGSKKWDHPKAWSVSPQIWHPKPCRLPSITQRLKSAGFKEMLSYPFWGIPLSLCTIRYALSCHCFSTYAAYYHSHLCISVKTISQLLFHDKGDSVRITEFPKIIAEKFSWINVKISINQ